MSPSGLHLEDELLDGPGARALMPVYGADIASRYEGWNYPEGLPLDPDDVRPPDGRLVIAYLGQRPVACGALRRLDEHTGEVRRVYVADDMRRRGIAKLIMARLEQAAAEAGYDRVRLDTGDQQPEAVALYEALGYHQIEDYNGNPWASHWMEKPLPERAPAAQT